LIFLFSPNATKAYIKTLSNEVVEKNYTDNACRRTCAIYARTIYADFQSFETGIQRLDTDLLSEVVNVAVEMSDEELKQRTINGYSIVRENYTLYKYEENFKKITSGILKRQKNVVILDFPKSLNYETIID